MVNAQLEEIDKARSEIVESLLADGDRRIAPRDVPHAIEALIKVQKAERDLHDEALIGGDLADETDVSSLLQ